MTESSPTLNMRDQRAQWTVCQQIHDLYWFVYIGVLKQDITDDYHAYQAFIDCLIIDMKEIH